MRATRGRRLAVGTMALGTMAAALAGCGSATATVHAGSAAAKVRSSHSNSATVVCSTAPPALAPAPGSSDPGTDWSTPTTGPCTTVASGIPSTTAPGVSAPLTTVTLTVPPTTVPPTTAVPTTVPATTSTTSTSTSTSVPGCSGVTSLTLTPSGGPLGTQVTETARCFSPDTTITFEVPQSGGGGFRTATDASGTATMQFTYSAPSGIPGATTYPLLVTVDPNGAVDDTPCLPVSCAAATFYPR